MTSSAFTPLGPAFGAYPQRTGAPDAALVSAWRRLSSRLSAGEACELPAAVAGPFAATRARLQRLNAEALRAEIEATRAGLRQRAACPETAGQALALAAEVMARTLGKTPYDTQVHAAWLLLGGRLVEMATGEGKTLAAALAAAVAGLGGTPVHVLTANDYLVRRDRDALEPFYTAVSLGSACVTGGMSPEAQRLAWQHDIVYATAREVAFAYLRDHVALRGERDSRVLRAQAIAAEDQAAPRRGPRPAGPALPGLCMALVDEADSILLDEAVVPLILASPTSGLDVPAYRRAFEVSGTLRHPDDYTLDATRRTVWLSEAGRERVAEAVEGAGGALAPVRRACELVEAALAARLLYQRDREYAVAEGKLQLIDELTGRIAEGRQWQGALHCMVELREGLEPSPPTTVAAQITYQRFFPRYLRLGGMSGSLIEARHELRVLYDRPVVRVPLARPDRRRWLGERTYTDAAHKWRAVLHSVRRHAAAGRAVLVGTDSVADSARLSALLQAAGIEHQLLNATQNTAEADRIALAGTAGTVTVATNIAGRGTDIRLDTLAAERGGLHLIATMRNRSRRIDRQLVGRAARHGDPGSAEAVLALDDALLARWWPKAVLCAADAAANRHRRVPGWIAGTLFTLAQRAAEWRDSALRRDLRHADRQAAELHGFSGGTE